MELTTITLKWEGPLQAGGIDGPGAGQDGSFPKEGQKLYDTGLAGPGVYLYFMRYPRMTIVYVGRAADVSFRLREHLANYLGFRYPTRSADPDPAIDHRDVHAYQYAQPDLNGLNQFNNLSENLTNAIAEIQRMRIYYWPCDDKVVSQYHTDVATLTKDIESILIGYVRDLETTTAHEENHNRIVSDNFRRESRRNVVEVERCCFNTWLKNQIASETPSALMR